MHGALVDVAQYWIGCFTFRISGLVHINFLDLAHTGRVEIAKKWSSTSERFIRSLRSLATGANGSKTPTSYSVPLMTDYAQSESDQQPLGPFVLSKKRIRTV